jgi:hypothetical protein
METAEAAREHPEPPGRRTYGHPRVPCVGEREVEQHEVDRPRGEDLERLGGAVRDAFVAPFARGRRPPVPVSAMRPGLGSARALQAAVTARGPGAGSSSPRAARCSSSAVLFCVSSYTSYSRKSPQDT